MELNIEIGSTIGTCDDFMESKGAKKEQVSIISYPTKLLISQDGAETRAIFGCSMWQGCHNSKCHFSKTARQLPKVGSRS